MRETKFRVWVEEYKMFFYWNGRVFQNDQLPAERTGVPHVLWNSARDKEQYIDFKDQNDTEIYEGDVLTIGTHTLPRAVVVWDRDGFVFEWDASTAHIRKEKMYPGIPGNINCWHIIGNIHKNPELAV